MQVDISCVTYSFDFEALKLLQYCIKLRFFFTENLLFIFNRLIAIKIPKICFNYKADNYELRLTSHASAQDVGHPIDTQVKYMMGRLSLKLHRLLQKVFFDFFTSKLHFL